jgi:putative toxin-antitoxin system antitoxin component (TIGR02293 family)
MPEQGRRETSPAEMHEPVVIKPAGEMHDPVVTNLAQDLKRVIKSSNRLNRLLRHVLGDARQFSFEPMKFPVAEKTVTGNQAQTAMNLLRAHTARGREEISADAVETIVAVVNRAVEVLGNNDKAIQWLKTPIPSIGQTPMALLRTRKGAAQVDDVLSAIEAGSW